MTRRFDGKVAIVTGSSNGIGRATAVLFAEQGACVTITGRNAADLEETRKQMIEIGSNEDKIEMLIGDLTNDETAQELIDKTIQKFGKIDILINNAGGAAPDNTKQNGFDQSVEVYDYVTNLNNRSVLLLTKLAMPHLITSKGDVVNVSSICSQPIAGVNIPYYFMSKAALDQLTRALAATYIKDGVRVNSVNPGLISTKILFKQGLSDEAVKKAETAMESSWENIPAGRTGMPREVAESIAFLADRKLSGFIVGHCLVIDGGSSIICPLHNNYTKSLFTAAEDQ